MEFRDDASAEAKRALRDLNKFIKANTTDEEKLARATDQLSLKQQELAQRVFEGRMPLEEYHRLLALLDKEFHENIRLQKQAADAAKQLASSQQTVTAQLVRKGGMSDDLKAAATQLPLFGRFAGVMGPATAGLAAFGVAATVVRAEIELVGKAVGFASDNIKTAYEALDDAADAAEDLGIKANALRMLQVQAELAEVSTETLRNSLRKMMVNLGEAADDPRGGASKLFSKLRLDATELANQRPEKAFERIMTAIEDLPTRAQQLNAINDIFGRGNTEIIRLIGSYERYRDIASELATTLTDDQQNALDAAGESFRILQQAMSETWKEVAADVIPAVGKLADALADVLRDKEFRDTFVTTFKELTYWLEATATTGKSVSSTIGGIVRGIQDMGAATTALTAYAFPLAIPFIAGAKMLPGQSDVEQMRQARDTARFIQAQTDAVKEQQEAAERAANSVRSIGVEFSALATQPTLGGGAFSLFDGVGDRIKKMIDDQDKFLSQIREQNELIGKTREEQEQIKLGRITALTGAMEALKVVQDERAEKEKIVELEKEAAKLKNDQENEAERLRRSLMTRDEVAQENIAKWRELARTGLISDVELQKAIGRELGGLSSGKPAEVPSTLKAGTAEAMRAVFYRQQSKTEDLLGQIARNTKPDPAKQKIELVAEGM